MLVLVPQSLCDSPYGNDKHALKIVSRIVCDQIEQCHVFRASLNRKGPPNNPTHIYKWWILLYSEHLKIKQHLFCKPRFSEVGHLASMFR
jgi:hypothetical protein